MPKPISAGEFDRRFDDGEDMGDYIDWSSTRRPGKEGAAQATGAGSAPMSMAEIQREVSAVRKARRSGARKAR